MRLQACRKQRNESHDLHKLRRLKPVTLDFWQESIVRLQLLGAHDDTIETTRCHFVAGGAFLETERKLHRR